ncbi:nitrogen fixation protein NifX [Paenibacillus spiritus]|uniref:Nitrogen fixation protein NifX n=1 Tax=Paenibacillus spiritus TaxID=2496557 RepID=A0A5J5G0S7_9BACL|nr:nitrogen fixation protein NifX [Paenibacillus spiritus]KAA9000346.1 nitrogen fixation protein NifX [Paenibacillus spiritus]
MKVAFATDDGVRVNAHFGQSPMFAVYNVTRSGSERVGLRRVDGASPEDEAGRIEGRVEAVADCTLIFLMQIGASAAARVTRRQIMPVKVPAGSRIDEQVKRLSEMLQGKPPMWLAKVLLREEALTAEGGSPEK